MRVLFAAAVAAVLAACAAHQPQGNHSPSHRMPQTAEEATQRDTCGAARFAHLMGTLASEIDRSALPPRARILTPETMVTQDFSPERLNIMTGTDGRVSSMRCF
ncbi:MAG: I78 family peptidase inhibitor [Hyphomonadaceae bacterium]